MFTPGRLSLARRRRGRTKKGFADAIGVTPHTILRYESGEIEPPDSMIAKFSVVLDFPVEFFHEPDIDEVIPDAASFRGLTVMSAKDRDSALAAGSISYLLSDWIDRNFDLPESRLINLCDESPEVAARSLREEWALGEQPIKNMVHLLEAKGVRVFSLAENTKTVDAFSVWRGERPFVFLNMMKSPEHSRFDAAHELAHLVLHKHGGPQGRRAEEQANQFASAFLLPEEDVRARIPRIHTLNQIISAKKRWSVSVMALIYRLHILKILSDWQYRMFCIQATESGYRSSEPFGVPREQSIIWQKLLTALWNEKVTKKEIAEQLHVPQKEVENLLFGLANMLSNSESNRPERTSGGLKLVSD